MTESAILNWHDYFITVAQVSATLTGLLFVGLTISLGHMLQGYGYLMRAFTALFLQFEMLLVGLFAIVPGQPAAALGAEMIVTGLAFLAGISVFAHNFPESETSQVLGSTGPRTVRAVLTYLGTLMPVVAGLGLIVQWPAALYFLIPGEIACLYLSIGNAWVFAVEIPRRAGQKGTVP
jgi:modulator of FtsH protease